MDLKETPVRTAKMESRVNQDWLENLDRLDCLERWVHRVRWDRKALLVNRELQDCLERRVIVDYRDPLETSE